MKNWLSVLGVVALMVLCGLLGYGVGGHVKNSAVVGDTVRVKVTDTVRCFVRVPKDSVVVKYVRKMLPVVSSQVAQSAGIQDSAVVDSAMVELAITQREYSDDSTYRAWVSGYEPRLDSITVYRERLRETITIPVELRQSRRPRVGFGLSCGLGYGILHKQADVFVGGGLVVNF